MATQTPIPIFSQRETFYVPQVEVYVSGRLLQDNVVNDILQVTYTDSIKDIDQFQIEINNWDADNRTFKFAPPLKSYQGVFDPGNKIEIRMGYQGNMRRMMRGLITSLTPVYSEAAPTLSITGLSELHRFRTEQHTYSWINRNMTDTQIAQELCAWSLKKGQPGLGIKIDVNPAANEQPDPIVFLCNQYDIVFLLERARRRGYDMYLEDEGPTPTLYFGLSENAASAPVYQLEWGKSLVNFRPTLSTADQISSVTVRGWDRKSNKAIVEACTLQQLWKEQKKSAAEIARLTQIAKAYSARSYEVTDEPMHTVKEAKDRARAILDNKNKRLIEASGTTVGLPDLRTGCSVEILGFGVTTDTSGNLIGTGSDFDGEYFVTGSTHTIGGGGYQTQFTARRQGLGRLPQPNA
jgi:uncharacterized protein